MAGEKKYFMNGGRLLLNTNLDGWFWTKGAFPTKRRFALLAEVGPAASFVVTSVTTTK